MTQEQIILVLGALLCVSEALTGLGIIKANGVIQLVINILRAGKKALTGK